MPLLFDTGSTWTWVPSSDCPDSECINSHYEWRNSTEFWSTNEFEDVTYGKGYIKGYMVID